jgi:predicted RNase H-like HicB family nuclease
LRYAVAIVPEQDERGYFAVVPSLPGCFSQGATVEEAERNVAEAIALHVRAGRLGQGRRRRGEAWAHERSRVRR